MAEEKKDICHLNVYVKYEQNRWLRHCKIKSLFQETKQFNFPEKNVPSLNALTQHISPFKIYTTFLIFKFV